MRKCLLLILCISVLTFGCRRNNSLPLIEGFAHANEVLLDLSNSVIVASNNATEDTVHISTNVAWAATIQENVSWLSISPKNGTGDATLNISVDKSDADSMRSATITIETKEKTRQITVVQSPAGEQSLSVFKSEINGGYAAFEDTLLVLTSNKWTIPNIADIPDWITVTPASGIGVSQVVVSIGENATTNSREGSFEIATDYATQTISISQAGHAFSVTPTTIDIPYEGGKETLTISTPNSWEITDVNPQSALTWVHPTSSATSGTGNSTFSFTVDENYTAASRSVDVKIVSDNGTHSEIITITQAVNPALDISNNIQMNREGGYLDLTNGADFMEVSSIPAFNIPVGKSLSVSLKVKVNGNTPTVPRLFFIGSTRPCPQCDVKEGYEMFLESSSGHVQFTARDENEEFLGSILNDEPINIIDGQWHHLVGVFDYDNKEAYMYVDGQKVGVQDLSAKTIGNIFTGDEKLIIGDWKNGGWNFNGYIDDFRVWNKALTPTEVYADAANVTLPSASNHLIVGWNFDGPTQGIYSSLVSSHLEGGAKIIH